VSAGIQPAGRTYSLCHTEIVIDFIGQRLAKIYFTLHGLID
jgi:hypothetical protein